MDIWVTDSGLRHRFRERCVYDLCKTSCGYWICECMHVQPLSVHVSKSEARLEGWHQPPWYLQSEKRLDQNLCLKWLLTFLERKSTGRCKRTTKWWKTTTIRCKITKRQRKSCKEMKQTNDPKTICTNGQEITTNGQKRQTINHKWTWTTKPGLFESGVFV